MERIASIEEINKIAGKYASKQISEFEKNRNTLIEAFVEYYGEKYRDLITNRISNVSLHSCISNATAACIDENVFKYVKTLYSKIYRLFKVNLIFALPDFSDFTNFYMLTDSEKVNALKFKLNCDNDKANAIIEYINNETQNELFDDMITFLNFYDTYIDYAEIYPSNDLDNYTYEKTHLAISSEPNSGIFFQSFEGTIEDPKFVPYIFTSIFSDERVLIHELNHFITSNALGLIETESEWIAGTKYNLMEKTGIQISNGLKAIGEFAEEVINDLAAIEIVNIFHKHGGKMEYPMLDTTIDEWETFKNAGKPFYEKYKDIIKEARITENKNLLFKYIDKDKFNKFSNSLIKILKPNGKIDYDIENLLCELVDSMDREPIDIDVDKFIEELKSQGKEVIPLSHKSM